MKGFSITDYTMTHTTSMTDAILREYQAWLVETLYEEKYDRLAHQIESNSHYEVIDFLNLVGWDRYKLLAHVFTNMEEKPAL